MAWVRSEYAGALAVLCTWATALLPWSVTASAGADIVVIRFQWFLLQFLPGLELPGSPLRTVLDPPATGTAALAGTLWQAAAAVVTVLFLFSLAYYGREEDVEALPVDPVRLTGTALLVVSVLHGGALVVLWQEFPDASLTVPVGVLFEFAFAGVLLAVERD